MTQESICGGMELPCHASRSFCRADLSRSPSWWKLRLVRAPTAPCFCNFATVFSTLHGGKCTAEARFLCSFNYTVCRGLQRESDSYWKQPANPQEPMHPPWTEGVPWTDNMGNVNPQCPWASPGVIISLFKVFEGNTTYSQFLPLALRLDVNSTPIAPLHIVPGCQLPWLPHIHCKLLEDKGCDLFPLVSLGPVR